MTKSNTKPTAGHIGISKLLLVSHENEESIDILNNYIAITLDESIRNPYVEGYIDIADSYGMIYDTVSDNA